jgi:hypothetical protein
MRLASTPSLCSYGYNGNRSTLVPVVTADKLTTAGVASDGSMLHIDFIDAAGKATSLRLGFEQAGALAMTLPQLMSAAVKARLGSDTARYVFPLGQWSIEATPDFGSLILSLKTTDGFEVAFSVPLAACRSLAWALQDDVRKAASQQANPLDGPADSCETPAAPFPAETPTRFVQ